MIICDFHAKYGTAVKQNCKKTLSFVSAGKEMSLVASEKNQYLFINPDPIRIV